MKDEKNDMLYGIMRVVKTRQNDNDKFMVVIGRTIISRGTFNTKEDAIDDANKLDTEMVCKILVGVVDVIADTMNKTTRSK